MNKESKDYLLLKRIKMKDKSAFDEFYLKNEPLVYSLVKKYVHKTRDYEELIMCAKYGLVLAIYNFDLSYGVQFSTYAVPIILGEIKQYFKNLNLLKVSRRIIELNNKILDLNESFIQLNNRSLTIEELKELLNESKEDIIEALSYKKAISSLDEEVNVDTPQIELVKEDGLSLNDKMELQLALEGLDKKERIVIELRYFNGLTQQEVSQRLNMSQVQISRIENKTLAKLREMMI